MNNDNRIGILSLPPSFNYGGILQVFALQFFLREKGVNSIIIDRRFPRKITLIQTLIELKKIIFLCIPTLREKYSYDKRKREHFNSKYKHFINFINTKLNISQPIYSTKRLKQFIYDNDINTIIVGSDQVWRPQCSPNISDYFLKFIESNDTIKKISYAASFGTDNIEFNENEISEISKLLKKFNFVSLREISGVRNCKSVYGVNAQISLDPTFLLSTADYNKLINKTIDKHIDGNGGVVTYILDTSQENDMIISSLLSKIGYSNKNDLLSTENGVFISIEKWLSKIKNAQFVITDSFHGCVFSIIFNKPFVAIGNHSRGITRFNSLLSQFGLEDKLIVDKNIINYDYLLSPIDWNKVNTILEVKKKSSIDFLLSSLYDKSI